jgi:hypothetical protein
MARIQFKRGSTQDWETANPVLLPGTPGYDTTTGVLKVGDGVKAWKDMNPVGSGGGGIDQAAVDAAVAQAVMGKADKTEVQGLINALCSAPFTGMTGNTVNNTSKVGIWVSIVKKEIESLEDNLGFVYTKTTENKAAITGVQDRVTALEGAALGGGGVSQAVVDSLLARLDALEAENVTLKAEVTDLRAFVGEQNQNLTDMHNSDMTQVAQELAKKANITVTDGLQNQIRLNTQYIDQQTGTVIQYVDLVAEQKADKSLVDSHTADINTLGDMYQQQQDTTNQTFNDVVEYIIAEYATKAALAEFGGDVEMAVGNVVAEAARFDGLFRKFGAGNTAAECVDDFFATLNDIVGKLLDATGVIPRDGKIQPVAAGDTRIVALEAMVGRLAARADDEKTYLEADVLNMLTGGKEVPPNIDWTPCKRVAGTGVIEARLINGVVQFRGDLKYTQTATGSFAGVQKLPDGFPPPSVDTNLTAWAIETGVAYKIGMIRLGVNRDIGVSAPTGKFDTITFNGISYPVF